MTIRKLPIGIQDFEDIRTNGYVYVDKTAWIYRMVTTGKPYFLGRPRRFGKSLLLSTLRSYFEGKRELFDGLAISGLEKDWTAYPVFHLDLNAGVFDSLDGLEDTLDSNLRDLEERWGRNPEERTPSSRLKGLIQRAAESTPEKKVVVLIDEYDKPLLQTMHDDKLQDAIRNALKGFYGVLKSADRWLRFVMLTGVTKFSKVSVFSDLNQLRDISMVEDYSEVCGITETELINNFDPEIHALAEEQGMSRDEALDGLRRRYDGYRFSPGGERVYNPFSVLNTLQNREFGYYWFQTGTPTFLIKQIKDTRFDIPELTEGVSVPARLINDYRLQGGSPIPLLYQSGYLTIQGYDARRGLYTLGFPNEEVKIAFLEELLEYYLPQGPNLLGLFAGDFADDLENGDIQAFMGRLKALVAAIPYDVKGEETEHYFQTVVYLLFTLMGQYVQPEVHSHRGRSDVVVITDNAVYVFELKIVKGESEDRTAAAIRQIEEKDYLGPYRASGKRLFKIGAQYDTVTRAMGEPNIQEE